nr:ent-kaur-16-ene synthase, chloroplastic [Ipomoea batatas]
MLHHNALFPWVLNNQNQDGSWGLHHNHPMFLKEVLLSTLACVLALERWGVGEEQIYFFIELNFTSAADNGQLCPTGFDIIFPGMLNYLNDSSLRLNLELKTNSTKTDQQTRNLVWLNLLNSMLREAEWTKDDGFTSQGLAGTVKPILHHPIHLHLI